MFQSASPSKNATGEGPGERRVCLAQSGMYKIRPFDLLSGCKLLSQFAQLFVYFPIPLAKAFS